MANPQYGFQPFPQPPNVPTAPLEKPTAAFVLSLIGGIFILLWGLVLAALGVAAENETLGLYGGGAIWLGVIEAILGLLVIIFGVLLYVLPEHHVVLGVFVLLCSIFSLIGLGGLLIGFILGLIGGVLGIVHKPTPPPPTVVYVHPQRMCVRCGRAVQPESRFCPNCGNALT
ncbi:MAG: DUF6114 domain-containing protein [Thermoplasmata archaeon]